MGPHLGEKLKRAQPVFFPESAAPEVFVIILGSLAQPTYPIPSPTRKIKQLFVPHPIASALLQHRPETQISTCFQKPPLLARTSRFALAYCPKIIIVEFRMVMPFQGPLLVEARVRTPNEHSHDRIEGVPPRAPTSTDPSSRTHRNGWWNP